MSNGGWRAVAVCHRHPIRTFKSIMKEPRKIRCIDGHRTWKIKAQMSARNDRQNSTDARHVVTDEKIPPKKIVAVSIFVWPLNVWAVSARTIEQTKKKYRINLFLCIFCRIKVSFPVDWILILRSTPAVTENSTTTSKMYEWMVTDGKNDRTNDACLNKSHLIICWMAPNVCVYVRVCVSFCMTECRVTPLQYVILQGEKKHIFFSCPILFLDTFLLFLLFGAQFAHVKLVLLLFLFSLSAHRSSLCRLPRLFYITLIFWYLLISVVPLKFIYYTFADTAKSSTRKYGERTECGTGSANAEKSHSYRSV